jgi:LuxR family maltose regulon positive regulatory protein
MGHHLKGLATLVRILMSRGEFDEARQVMEEIRSVVRRTQLHVWDILNEALALRIEVLQAKREGRPELAVPLLRWAEETGLMEGWDDLRPRLMPDLPRDFGHLTVAHGLHAAGRFPELLALLGALRKVAEEEDWRRTLLEIDVLEALAGGPAALERALAFAEPEGYVQVFVDEGAPMARLLAALPGGPFVERLRQALGSAPAPEAPPPSSGEELSDRELEVLRAVAGGLSNAEAARRLYLSPFTVKKHLENIYGKLGVRNRTEAIARMQKLGQL